jgi:hypothetical protein
MKSSVRVSVVCLIAVGVQLLQSCFMAVPAVAQPNFQIIAGTGEPAFGGDGGPAQNAKFLAPMGLTLDAAGNIYIADIGNRRIRKIRPDGVITTHTGNGSFCGDVNPVTYIGSYCSDPSIVAAPDSTLYSAQGRRVSQITSDGVVHHYGGKPGGFCGPWDDGPKYESCITAKAVAYDEISGDVYFTEDSAIRKITPSGQIVTVAGHYSLPSPGCNSVSPNEAVVSDCFYPTSIAVRSGKVYFVEEGSRTPARIRVIDGNAVHTISGGSAYADPVDGSPIASATFKDIGSFAIDRLGNMYVAGRMRGQIWQLSIDDGKVHRLTEFEGGIFGLATDAAGSLYASLSYKHQIVKLSGLLQPRPLPRVSSITPALPDRNDAVLTRGVMITPSTVDPPAVSYQYAWANSSTASEPTTGLQHSDTTYGRLSYRDTSPDQDWWLMARGIDGTGQPGPWSAPHLVHTPKAPNLIVLGDSISSGHHNDYDDNHKTTCDDGDNYGYAYEYSKKWKAQLPSQWLTADSYTNLAHSGFATQSRLGSGIGGSVISGGQNACRRTIPGSSPLAAAQNRLSDNKSSWNSILISAGANDTNWGGAVKAVIEAEVAKEYILSTTPIWLQLLLNFQPDINEFGCRIIIKSRWNGNQTAVRDSIKTGVRKITSAIQAADSTAKATWLGYYNIAGTGTNRTRPVPYMPSACSRPVGEAMANLHSTIQSGLPAHVGFVSTQGVMDLRNDFVQPLYAFDEAFGGPSTDPAGWPHPNKVGAEKIANLIQL